MTHPDRRPTLKQLAKQGDRSALTELIKQAVAYKQMTAMVTMADTHLEVCLEAAVTPDQQIATTLIQRELTSLKQVVIATATISGKQSGAEQFA